MKIGDHRIIVRRDWAGNNGYDEKKFAGTVVYIHPLHRFFTVRLDIGYDESFPLVPIGMTAKPVANSAGYHKSRK
jgi:hypothetical protein